MNLLRYQAVVCLVALTALACTKNDSESATNALTPDETVSADTNA